MDTMATHEDQTYNGWKNYATWGVSLVLDNEQGLHGEIDVTLTDYNDPENISEQERDGIWTHDEAVRFQLEDYIKNLVEELCEENYETINLMQRQVLQAGLAEVDWKEITESWISR